MYEDSVTPRASSVQDRISKNVYRMKLLPLPKDKYEYNLPYRANFWVVVVNVLQPPQNLPGKVDDIHMLISENAEPFLVLNKKARIERKGAEER